MPNTARTPAQRLADVHRIVLLTRTDLYEQGLSPHAITAGVLSGALTRVRRGLYVAGEIPAEVFDAVRIGGRIACLTLLRLIGVFVLEAPGLHVQVPPQLSRSRHRRLPHATLHWGVCLEGGSRHAVSLRDAVRQAVRCQPPRAAIATLDSVLHHRLLTYDQVAAIFRQLPQRFQALLPLVDLSAESGPETFMRLLLRALGLSFETQVTLPGIGRVDFVVEGWLIIECDSRGFHAGWDKQVDDRHRDLAAARLGYVTIRPLASDIFQRPDAVREAVADVVRVLGGQLRDRRASQLRRNRRETAVKGRSDRRSARISGVLMGGPARSGITERR